MATTTLQTITLQRLREDPKAFEAVYYRWTQPGATTPAVSTRASRIFECHLELATLRRPGAATLRVYRPEDPTGLGPAIQIVNDDMPHLVESVSSMLRRVGVVVTDIVHPIIDALRDNRGVLRAIAPSRSAEPSPGDHTVAESWIHIQLAESVGADQLRHIEQALPQLLATLRSIAGDTPAMTTTLLAVAAALGRGAGADSESVDNANLLNWLADGRFTLLGYGYHAIDSDRALEAGSSDTVATTELRPTAGLGILHQRLDNEIDIPLSGPRRPVLRLSNISLDPLLPGAADGYVVTVSDFGDTVRGEHIFIGSFTVTGQHENILDIPVISRRIRQVIEWAGFGANSFSGQAMLQTLQTLPRAELFCADTRRLFETVSAIMDLGPRRQVRLFLRPDARSTALYCLVYLPRDRYSTDVRLRMRDILRDEFDAEQIDYSARASESELAVVYFTVHRRADAAPVDTSAANLERVQDLLFATTRTWADLLITQAAVTRAVPGELARDYAAAFPATYQQEFTPARALADLWRLNRLDDGTIDTDLHREVDAPDGEWRFTLYVHGAGISLSRILPILHSVGAEVVDERPYPLTLPDGTHRWIYDFGLRIPSTPAKASRSEDTQARTLFAQAVEAMWFGRAEIDSLNELVLSAGLNWREISVLRAYAKYLQQAGFSYSFASISKVLLSQPATASAFMEFFTARCEPTDIAIEDARTLDERLLADIESVVGLDTDRILRAIHGLIRATLRTNYFRVDETGGPREALSFKFDPRAIAELPKPRPQFEIWVYSPRVEGVHLRFGPVARGGLRWSDRLEDFRTEILGLAKAQAVKNAVIVPVGAKGGFVVKNPPAATADPVVDRQALQAEGIACYRIFISGLLDITDNIDRITGEVIPPPHVHRRDGDDTYLVVAADKGTATFSDIANDVAQSYGFWLGDAFASGGSVGYDHKAMGITAKGAWESVKRHFAEMDIDTQTEDFTVVGVGDMSGDVFGNGMLLSRHIRLVAAFDHRHIFLDPNPDAATSFAERERMFALPRSSWADYDRSLISEGGGVYDRTVKSVPISDQVREALGLAPEVTVLSPPELIRAILKSPVQLLWNGGIGTYIKASAETNADVGDKSNDVVRVNANELRLRVIGEGGNLGVTALGRIEFCRYGGKMNTDALDNSAGVDCSDHEVNIKVLLDRVVAEGSLSISDRNAVLASMTDEVAEHVLRDNVSQNFRLGLSRAHAPAMAAVHRRLIADLEDRHGLDRDIEALPSDAEMARRIAAGTGLTSAELANLLAHVKLSLKQELLAGQLPDNPAFAAVLPNYFPAPLRERFGSAMRHHPLRHEIVATTVVNRVVDYGGTTFVFRLVEEMGVTVDDAVRAFTAVTEIFDLHQLWLRIRTTPMPTAVRDELELETKRTLDRACRWLLTNRPQPIAIGTDIARYRHGVRAMSTLVPEWRRGVISDELLARAGAAIDRGGPRDLVEEVYLLIYRFPLLDIVDIAEVAEREQREVIALYYHLERQFDFQRLLDAVVRLERSDRWHTLARLAVRDDLYDSLKSLTLDVLRVTAPADTVAEKILFWESLNSSRLARARVALDEIFAAGTMDLATLSVAARQVRSLAGGVEPTAVV
ncbi:NAD-glutamate dehydrogenase [Nocardia sp. NPDC046763]|uniref:NAD-glutamate dehydrogenase n=1 Tax=Nocardia sp. NPDC046763 TaxID=3155256 RepID=UPI0033EDC10C